MASTRQTHLILRILGELNLYRGMVFSKGREKRADVEFGGLSTFTKMYEKGVLVILAPSMVYADLDNAF